MNKFLVIPQDYFTRLQNTSSETYSDKKFRSKLIAKKKWRNYAAIMRNKMLKKELLKNNPVKIEVKEDQNQERVLDDFLLESAPSGGKESARRFLQELRKKGITFSSPGLHLVLNKEVFPQTDARSLISHISRHVKNPIKHWNVYRKLLHGIDYDTIFNKFRKSELWESLAG